MRDLHSFYAGVRRARKAAQFLHEHSKTIDRAATIGGKFSIGTKAARYFLLALIVLLAAEGVYLKTTKL